MARQGYNFKALVQKWEEIVHRLCDEVTPHDVLSAVKQYLDLVQKDFEKQNLNGERFKKASDLLEQVLKLLDPEE